MAKIIPIGPRLMCPVPYGRPVKRRRSWYLWVGPELGQRPRGHPPLVRGPRGKALLAVNQVWVRHSDSMLWVIREIKKGGAHPAYPNRVVVAPYYRSQYLHELAEATLRLTMSIWEDEIRSRRESIIQLRRAARLDPGSPWRGSRTAAQSAYLFFDIDEYGNRAD